MRQSLCTRLWFDRLEDRTAPAILIDTLSVPGDLIITSVAGAQTNTLLIEQTGPGDFDITENGGLPTAVSGIFGDVTINLTTFPGSINPAGISLNFNLTTADDMTGDLSITLPNATSGHFVQLSSPGGGAIIGDFSNPGNVTIVSGTGAEVIYIGAPAANPIDIFGAVVLSTGAGFDDIHFHGGTIFNHVTVTNANRVWVGHFDPTTIEGNLVSNNSSDTTNVAGVFTLFADTVVMGDLTLTNNRRNDTVLFETRSQVHGDATLSLNHGVNSFTMDADSQVRGNLSYTGGNQRDLVTLNAGSLVLGDSAFNLGSSGRTATTRNELSLAGTMMGVELDIIGGNGVDVVNYDANGVGAELLALLGSGNDTFTLGAAAVFASMDIDGGFGRDTFVNLLGLIQAPFALRKFP